MNVTNFTAKLKVDPNLGKSLKISPVDEIVRKTKLIVESPVMQELLKEDTIELSHLKRNVHGFKEGILIKIGEIEIPIQSKQAISANQVVNKILLQTCLENGEIPRSASAIEVRKSFKSLVKSFFSK